MRDVVSTEGIVGGSPCIDGTRLTCANVAQSLKYQSVDEYLSDYSYLTHDDLLGCLKYCAERKCVEGHVANYCEHCTLDTRPNDPETSDTPEMIWLLSLTLLEERFPELQLDI